jgi:hypothetical protein
LVDACNALEGSAGNVIGVNDFTPHPFRFMPAAGRPLTGGKGGDGVLLVIHPPRRDLRAISNPS